MREAENKKEKSEIPKVAEAKRNKKTLCSPKSKGKKRKANIKPIKDGRRTIAKDTCKMQVAPLG